MGRGSDVWEKFPNNVVFFFDSVPNSVVDDADGFVDVHIDVDT